MTQQAAQWASICVSVPQVSIMPWVKQRSSYSERWRPKGSQPKDLMLAERSNGCINETPTHQGLSIDSCAIMALNLPITHWYHGQARLCANTAEGDVNRIKVGHDDSCV
jgi:hypothetical protein